MVSLFICHFQEAIHSSQEMRKNEQEFYKAHGTDVFKTEMVIA